VSPASMEKIALGTGIPSSAEVQSSAATDASVDSFEAVDALRDGAATIGDSSEFQGPALGPLNGRSLHVLDHATPGVDGLSAGATTRTNGHANGHTNGYTNGHTNGHANGHSNGHANGQVNGHANGQSRLDALHVDSRSDMARLAAAAATVVPVSAPAFGAAFARATVAPTAPGGVYVRLGKRLLDILGATVALVCFAPLMAFCALLLKIDSRGPAFYRSKRLGKNGREFTFYKLRSMHVGADNERDQLMHLNEADGPVFKLRRDPRVTRVGQVLRSTSIDELPQFINVLKGDMSLVGPRPPLPEEAEKYEAWQLRRLDVKPGITCLWQISGRSQIGFDEWMRLDLEYIRRQSLSTDLWILMRTVPAVLSREGAY
jgi:lipopolysaccharide/colanic/teichoic acid biosynthesis glycosyltransferase